jgi:hypothetical protein
VYLRTDRLCGLVRVPGYRSRGPDSIPGATRFSEKYWVWNIDSVIATDPYDAMTLSICTNFADKRRSLGLYSSLVD